MDETINKPKKFKYTQCVEHIMGVLLVLVVF